METAVAPPALSVRAEDGVCLLLPSGDWVTANAETLERAVRTAAVPEGLPLAVDGAGVTRLDTLGAWLLYRVAAKNAPGAGLEAFKGFAAAFLPLLSLAARESTEPILHPEPDRHPFTRIIEDIGRAVVTAAETLGALLSFFGLVLSRLSLAVRAPRRFRLPSIVHQMELAGFRATGITVLISFLIGAVIVNQGAAQLRRFGAEVFVVEMVAIAHLRELGILLTSIIIAGRSGSAFTAQLGSMVLHEEVDALKTIGLHPVDVLVLPRLIALVIMLPVLTFIADMAGLLGGALMAWSSLGISPQIFADRARETIEQHTFWIGIIKAPFFALVIAISGCFEGLSCERTAESVGAHTTKAVVQSIFIVIVLDALFAMFFTAVGW